MANPTDVGVVVDKVTAYLDSVAAKLGVAAGKVWPWLVKQQVLEGLSIGAFLLVGAVGTFFSIKGLKVWWGTKTGYEVEDAEENKIYLMRTIWTVFGVISAIMLLIGTVDFISCGLHKLINPEYHALMDLIHAVK